MLFYITCEREESVGVSGGGVRLIEEAIITKMMI